MHAQGPSQYAAGLLQVGGCRVTAFRLVVATTGEARYSSMIWPSGGRPFGPVARWRSALISAALSFASASDRPALVRPGRPSGSVHVRAVAAHPRITTVAMCEHLGLLATHGPPSATSSPRQQALDALTGIDGPEERWAPLVAVAHLVGDHRNCTTQWQADLRTVSDTVLRLRALNLTEEDLDPLLRSLPSWAGDLASVITAAGVAPRRR